MGFIKKEWKDRLSQFPNRRKLTDTTTGDEQIVDVSRVEGTVGEVGDGFNEENMNDLEDRIEDGFDSIAPETLGEGYGTCSTAAATTAKEATLTGYKLVKNGRVSILFDNDVPADATLSINNETAKPIFYNGVAITAGKIKAGMIATFVYDGTNYVLIPGGGGDDTKEMVNVETRTWAGIQSLYGQNVWTDGDNIYHSNGSAHVVLNKTTGEWESKTWTGLTNFSGSELWTDGTDVYYSNQNTQYVLDKANSSWSTMTWGTINPGVPSRIWTDADGDVYYSNGNAQYKLDKANHNWIVQTWTGLSKPSGEYVWVEGSNTYYSYGGSQYILDKANSAWLAKSWTGLLDFNGTLVWQDVDDTYYYADSSSNKYYKLDPENSRWRVVSWNYPISGDKMWNDGEHAYYSNGSGTGTQLVVVHLPAEYAELGDDGKILPAQTNYVTAGKKSGTTLGTKSTAEGIDTTASGNYAHAEGYKTTASNQQAHAEGNSTTASGSGSHAEGCSTTASGGYSHAEGNYAVASTTYAHAEGNGTTASHEASHAEGWGTVTGNAYQHVGGKFNVGKSTTAFEVGKGTNGARSNAFEVEWDGDTTAAGEITDGGGNVLSDKYDATSLTFPNERFTISASGWSSTQTGGYYTYTLSTGNTKYNTYCPVFMDKTGVDDSTDLTSAEEAAYALVDKFDMANGTGVNSFTLYAKTKPTTTFYIKLSGQYMAKNAASSTKALDIKTGCSLGLHTVTSAQLSEVDFDGSVEHSLKFISFIEVIPSSGWSNTVDANGYYYQTISLGSMYALSTNICPSVSLCGLDDFTLPTSAEIAAYNLVDKFYMPSGVWIQTSDQLTVFAKTKPTTTFYVRIKGVRIS